MSTDILFAGIPVSDFDAALAWYQLLFERPPDLVAHPEEMLWHVAESGWVYVVRDPARAGRALVTVAVADLDETLVKMETRGLSADRVESLAAGRKATLTDPEGNHISFVEVAQPGK
ncbi:MAG: VOC family protein [Candidatus Dormiibacterota bacterium]